MRRYQNRARRPVHHLDLAEAVAAQLGLHRLRVPLVRQRKNPRLPPPSLFQRCLDIAAGGQSSYLKSIGIALHNTKRAPSDRAGRTQDGDAFHAEEGRFLFYGNFGIQRDIGASVCLMI
jgi:hypothetical protein